jgi:hypothetical protein
MIYVKTKFSVARRFADAPDGGNDREHGARG